MAMHFNMAGKILLGVLAMGAAGPAYAKTCFMVYQLADNTLEAFINHDYGEISRSPAVHDTNNVRTWVYYDANKGIPLTDTVDANGNSVSNTHFTGSRYMTYDGSIDKMRVDKELSGEQNSDSPGVVQSFLTYALTDCLADGYDSLFAVFSGHGGGFAGYGQDEHTGRKLLDTDAHLAGAIRSALSSVQGAPNKLEVIGFDACMMQAVGAADDFSSIANYILASEAVEPGTGWAYDFLKNTTSALSLAEDALTAFLQQTQGEGQQTPKTMAIVNTDKFVTFMSNWEGLAGAMLTEIKNGDKNLYTLVSRARSNSITFEGVVDASGSKNPSNLDIGSFLGNLQNLCNPGGDVGTYLASAISSYNDMFYKQGNGPGTAGATGMYISWPNQGEYASQTNVWNVVLFNNANYITTDDPKTRAFLQFFLPAPSVTDSGSSVCGMGSTAAPQTDSTPNEWIKSATASEDSSGNYVVDAQISGDVNQMLVEYGVDLTTPLVPFLKGKGYDPDPNNYLYLLGGDVAGNYSGNEFTASWDQNFYFLNISNSKQFEALYVFDQGNGMKKIPAMYFPENTRDNVTKLQLLDFLFFNFTYWQEQGAQYAFLQFSIDKAQGRTNNHLTLYTSKSDGSFAEKPRKDLGLLAPLVYVDGVIKVKIDNEYQGKTLSTLPGGFNQTLVNWTENIDYNILTTPREDIFNVIPTADAIIMNVYAYNYNAGNDPQHKYFDVDRRSGQLHIDVGNSTPAPTPSPGSSSTKLSFRIGMFGGLSMLVFAFIEVV